MAIRNEYSASLLQAQFRALNAVLTHEEFPSEAAEDHAGAPDKHVASPPPPEPGFAGHMMTRLMRHGGLYTLMDSQMMTARLIPLLSGPGTIDMQASEIDSFVNSLSSKVAAFFTHLAPETRTTLDSSLTSHISFPCTGLVYTKDSCAKPGVESPVPAAFTFVGQFIDHDLTMNGVNLFDPQTGSVQDTASPLIDLDSVYGPRTLLNVLPPSTNPNIPSLPKDLFEEDGTFKLSKQGAAPHCYYDLCRDPKTHKAYIADARNDENALVLQVHLLIMRVHNKLIRTVYNDPHDDLLTRLNKTYKEVLLTWQTVILDDYLTRILRPDVYAFLKAEIAKPDFGAFKNKPLVKLSPPAGQSKYVASMSHEFAIGFRMGHSQLKPCYILQGGGTPIPLFKNELRPDAAGNVNDLRGSQPLVASHVIDWPFFAGQFPGNLIDSHVTSVVFDLPESAIPDDIKFIGNLAQRNLIRGSQVGLCSGEDLAALYGVTALTPQHVDAGISVLDPTDPVWVLYQRQVYDSDGIPVVKNDVPVTEFATPLWYYLIKEAELNGTNGSLGELGSHLIGETILGAIKWGRHSALDTPPDGKVPTAAPGKATLLDLAAFVKGDC